MGGKIASPTDTFDREQKLAVGLVEVQLLQFGNGHTSADTVVYFPDLKATAMGNLYAVAPNPEYGVLRSEKYLCWTLRLLCRGAVMRSRG